MIAIITYTGGTTGGSKGVLQSNYGVVSNAWQYTKYGIELKRNAKWLLCFPLYIGFGIFTLLIPLRSGMEVILRSPLEDRLSVLYAKHNNLIF